MDTARGARCHFIIGSARSSGTASVSFPVGNIRLSFYIHVFDSETLILLSIDDVDCLVVYLNIVKVSFVYSKTKMKTAITSVCGSLFIQWNSYSSCLFRNIELGGLHRRFGHLSTGVLMRALDKSELDDVGPDTHLVLANIERQCNPCQVCA